MAKKKPTVKRAKKPKKKSPRQAALQAWGVLLETASELLAALPTPTLEITALRSRIGTAMADLGVSTPPPPAKPVEPTV